MKRKRTDGWWRKRRFLNRDERRGFDGINAELADISQRLMAAMETAEPGFLDMGETLQTLEKDARLLNRLTRDSARAARGVEAGDEESRRLDVMVENALDRLKSAHDRILESLNTITESLTRLDKLCAICPVIEKAGMCLNVVGFNIAVESSRSDDARQMFEIFSEEIRGLSRKISNSSRHILEDSLKTRDRQKAARSDIGRRTQAFEAIYKEAESVVRQAAEEIRALMDVSARTLDQSHARSRRIEREIGEVVVGLQFHDIARQKIEHITATLQDVRSAAGAAASEAISNHNGLIYLQKEQLGTILEELRNACDTSRGAFNALWTHVSELAGETADSDSRVDQVQHRIGTLKDGLAQLSRLLSQGRAMEESVKQNAAQIADMAVQLSHHVDQVRGISRDLHLNALNAIVKSTRLHSEGRALEILAQEVSRLSVETSGFVDDVVTEISALISLAETMEMDGLDAGDGESDRIEASINDMAAGYEQSIADAAKARAEAALLRERIGVVQEQLPFMETLLEELMVQWRRLSDICTEDGRMPEGTRDSGNYLDRVAERYTMASEREIHDRHTGRRGEGDARPALSETKTDVSEARRSKPGEKDGTEADDFGDNVELF